MVLIFSIKGDPSTNDVIDWLLYFGESYFRINNVIDLELLIKQYPISTIHKKENRFTSVWYRKAPDMFLPIDILGNTKTDKDIFLIQNKMVCLKQYILPLKKVSG